MVHIKLFVYVPIKFATARHQSICDGHNAYGSHDELHTDLVPLFAAAMATLVTLADMVRTMEIPNLVIPHIIECAAHEIVNCKMSMDIDARALISLPLSAMISRCFLALR